MVNSGTHIRRFFSFLAPLACLFCLFTSGAGMASEASNNCQPEYEKLHAQHVNAIDKLQPQSDEYYKTMHSIENGIFIAFQQCPKDPLLFSLMGEVQLSLGNHQLAILYANRAYNWEPNAWQTNHLVANTLLIQQKYQEALPFLQKAAELSSDKAELHLNLCTASFHAEEYEKAVSSCTRLLEMNNHDLKGHAYHIRAQAHKALDKNKLAAKDFDKAKEHGFSK